MNIHVSCFLSLHMLICCFDIFFITCIHENLICRYLYEILNEVYGFHFHCLFLIDTPHYALFAFHFM